MGCCGCCCCCCCWTTTKSRRWFTVISNLKRPAGWSVWSKVEHGPSIIPTTRPSVEKIRETWGKYMYIQSYINWYKLLQYIYILHITYYILYIIYLLMNLCTQIYIYICICMYIYIYQGIRILRLHTLFLDQQVASEGDAISATLAGQEPTCFGGMEACYFFFKYINVAFISFCW